MPAVAFLCGVEQITPGVWHLFHADKFILARYGELSEHDAEIFVSGYLARMNTAPVSVGDIFGPSQLQKKKGAQKGG